MSNKKTGHELLDEGKDTLAFGIFLAEAEDGSLSAMTYLGWMYETGTGVVSNKNEAERWYRKAIDAGSLASMFYLADMFLDDGKCEIAVELFKGAAEKSYSPAHYRLGIYYLHGVILSQDISKAENHFHAAAKMGHIFARRFIAVNMTKGRYGYSKILPGMFEFASLLLSGIRIIWKDSTDLRLLR